MLDKIQFYLQGSLLMKQIYTDFPQGITTIDTGLLRPGFTASHLIVEQTDAALIDVGPAATSSAILAALQHKQIAPAQVRYLLVTHVHLDHAGAVGTLIQHFPNAQVVVHPRGVRHLTAPERLIAGATAVYGAENLRALFGDTLSVPSDRVSEAADGQIVTLAGRPLLIRHTDGHARHHFCVVDERSQSVFTGDTFGVSFREFETTRGPFIYPTTTPVQFDPDAMHAAIEQILSYQPANLYLAHFGRVTAPRQLAAALHARIDQFVAIMRGVTASGEARQSLVFQQLERLLLDQIKSHGCTLPDAQICDLLRPDLQLNAMGLAVWQDRLLGKAKDS
jgi:glyoxylase-like metal-dependent hydrolase (beta-lactamase superfamily II)